MKPISIYIHIPFCKSKCKYCDFLSAPADCRTQEDYLCALKTEVTNHAYNYRDYCVRTVFIGGGTPSVVSANLLCEILTVIYDNYRVTENPEITMEINPGTVCKESLKCYRKAGINRISFGLQSANDEELKLLGRIHTYEEFLDSYKMAVSAGFTNINVDLMSALPMQKPETYENTLKKVIGLEPKPTHISAYSLIIEEGTPFYELYGEESVHLKVTGEVQTHLPSEEDERRMYELTEEYLEEAGYHRYEISNYALPSYECRHNKVYWQRGEYVGFGLGAASLIEEKRFNVTSDLKEYLLQPGKIEKSEILQKEDQMAEFMFLGLRLIEGVSKEEFLRCFDCSMDSVYGMVLRENQEKELLEITDTSVRLTKKGIDVSNYVMAQFLL